MVANSTISAFNTEALKLAVMGVTITISSGLIIIIISFLIIIFVIVIVIIR